MIIANGNETSNGVFKGLCSHELIKLWNLPSQISETFREIEESKKGRNLDFYIVPGVTVLRFPLENNKIYRNEIRIPSISSDAWHKVATILGESPLLIAYLAGEEERRPWIVSAMDQLVARILGEVEDFATKPVFLENEDELSRLNDRMSMAIYKTFKKIEADPLVLLTLYGKGTEELLADYKEKRFETFSHHILNYAIVETTEVSDKQPSAASATPVTPVELSSELRELKFPLKADELPGLVLRRFDPIPVTGSEDAVERLIEEAYDKISRRAQIRGLAFR
jgi:uncharacterized Zn finger protein